LRVTLMASPASMRITLALLPYTFPNAFAASTVVRPSSCAFKTASSGSLPFLAGPSSVLSSLTSCSSSSSSSTALALPFPFCLRLNRGGDGEGSPSPSLSSSSLAEGCAAFLRFSSFAAQSLSEGELSAPSLWSRV
jgi:hypothetical protein